MHIKIKNSKEFINSIKHCVKVASRKNPAEFTSYLFFEATAEGVVVRASSIVLQLQEKVPAEVVKPGKCCIISNKLISLVQTLDNFELIGADEKCTVKHEKSKYKIQTIPWENFQYVESPIIQPKKIEVAAFSKLLRTTAFASTLAVTAAPHFQTVSLKTIHEKDKFFLTASASDSVRLCFAKEKVEMSEPLNIDIPKMFIPDVLDFLGYEKPKNEKDGDWYKPGPEAKKSVEIGETENKRLVFISNTALMSFQPIISTFPDISALIKEMKYSTSINTKELNDALLRIFTVADSTSTILNFSLTPGTLEIKTQSDNGEGNEFITTDYTGEDIEFLIHGRQVLEFTKQCGQEFLFQFNDSTKICLVNNSHDVVTKYVVSALRKK